MFSEQAVSRRLGSEDYVCFFPPFWQRFEWGARAVPVLGRASISPPDCPIHLSHSAPARCKFKTWQKGTMPTMGTAPSENSLHLNFIMSEGGRFSNWRVPCTPRIHGVPFPYRTISLACVNAEAVVIRTKLLWPRLFELISHLMLGETSLFTQFLSRVHVPWT